MFCVSFCDVFYIDLLIRYGFYIRGAQSTELVSLYIGYWTLNNYYYYYYYYYYISYILSYIW